MWMKVWGGNRNPNTASLYYKHIWLEIQKPSRDSVPWCMIGAPVDERGQQKVVDVNDYVILQNHCVPTTTKESRKDEKIVSHP